MSEILTGSKRGGKESAKADKDVAKSLQLQIRQTNNDRYEGILVGTATKTDSNV